MKSKFHVPYQTARQLKEKGYPNNTEMLYDNETGELISSAAYANPKYWIGDKYMYLIAAPTYHEVVDWLEERKVRIYAEYCNGWWYGFIDNSETMEIEATVRYQTREEALNDGILKALEML